MYIIRHVFYGIGINKYKINKMNHTIHGECDCCDNIPYNNNKLHIKIDLFVSRTNPKGNRLLMSKPCDNCLHYIKQILTKKKYIVKRIYYIDIDSSIKYLKI